MYPKKPTNPSYLSAFFKVFPKTLAAFFSICLIFPTALLAENKNPISAGNFIEPKSEMRFDLPKKDAKEQCSIVSELYKKSRNKIKKKDNKFAVGDLYQPLNLFELKYQNNKIEVNEIVVMDGDRQPYSCLFYYNNKKIIGVDCSSSNYDEDPAELEDLLSTNDIIRYKNDCIGKTYNDGRVSKKIKTNCFVKLDLEKSQPLENDVLIKGCKAEFYKKN